MTSIRPASAASRFPPGTWAHVAHAFGSVFGACLGLFFGFFVLAPWLGLSDGPFDGSAAAFIGLLLSFAVLFVSVVWGWIFRVGRLSRRELGLVLSANPLRDVALGLGGFVVVVAIVFAALRVTGSTWAEIFDALAGFTLRQRLLFVAIAFTPPVIEEIVFRGELQPALAAKIGLPAAIVVGALVFALYHLQFRPVSIVVKTLQGIVYGTLRGRDRSLLASWTAHALVWIVLGAM